MASLLRSFCCLFVASLCVSSLVVAHPSPTRSLASAVEALANSGYSAMSLTLLLIGDTLPTSSGADPTLTIFSPSDKAFASSSEPSMNQLLMHFSPTLLPRNSLVSLPFGKTIPTLSHTGDLVVTSNGNKISIDNVRVSEAPIFDDGFVIVYGTEDFFEMNFTATPPTELKSATSRESSSGILSFLDLQLMGFVSPGSLTEEMMRWSLFSPADSAKDSSHRDPLPRSELYTGEPSVDHNQLSLIAAAMIVIILTSIIRSF